MASRAFDTFITYRIISTLVTDWENQPAFEHGIIDKKGKLLRKYNTLKTKEEKDSYTLFTRLIFNLKRINGAITSLIMTGIIIIGKKIIKDMADRTRVFKIEVEHMSGKETK